MATVPKQRRAREIEYPSADGKPMAETETHLRDMIDTIQLLDDHFVLRPNVYVCGNLLLYYEEGNPRKHVSPDVLVALDVPKKPNRDYYLVWKEGKAPDFIVEITSKSTRKEDQKKKFEIYRDILKVSEYFLFDPTEDYLDPPLQGFRLARGNMFPSRRWPDACQAGSWASTSSATAEASPVRSRDGPSLTDAARGARGGRAPRRGGTAPRRRRGSRTAAAR